MSIEEIKARARRFVEAYNKGKAAFLALMDEGYATDVVIHTSIGEDISGIKNYKQHVSEEFSAFPDMHMTFDDLIVEGNKIATRFTWTGTHKGEYRGIPPTDKKITIWGINMARMTGGKIVEEWIRYDTLGTMQQLGLVPTPKK